MKKLLFILLLALVASFGFAQTRQTGTVAVAKIDLYRDGGKPNTLMTGGGVISLDAAANLKWTQRFIILGGGRGAGTLSTNGYYDINMPAAGTVISGVCGAANQTVSAAGINMPANAWSTLWYQLPVGGAGTVNAGYKIAGYTADCVIPDDYVLVAAFNADNQSIKMGTGQIIKVDATVSTVGNDFFRSDAYSGTALPNGMGDNAKNVFLDANLSLKSMLNFRNLSDGRNTVDGLTWYAPTPTSYGLYRTAGAWAPPYPQAKLAFDTGIELQPSIAASTSPSYPKSYVNISAGGLRVERGNTGLGTLTPTTKLQVTTAVANDSGVKLENLTSASPANTGAVGAVMALGVDTTGKVVTTDNLGLPLKMVASGASSSSPLAGYHYESIVSYQGNGTFTTQTIQTKIPANTAIMPTIYIRGYDYGTADTVDLQLGLYTYAIPANSIINTVWQSKGTKSPLSIRAGFTGGLLTFEIVWSAAGEYFNRYEISAFNDGNSSHQAAWFSGWTVTSGALTAATTNVVTLVQKSNMGLANAPNYASVAAANADATLLTGSIYTVTAGGGRALYVK
jgi:hypothetical protein